MFFLSRYIGAPARQTILLSYYTLRQATYPRPILFFDFLLLKIIGVLLMLSIFQGFHLLVNMLEGWFVTLSYYPIIPTHTYKLTLICQIIAKFSFGHKYKTCLMKLIKIISVSVFAAIQLIS